MVSACNPTVLVVGTAFGGRIHVPALRAAGFEVIGLVGTDTRRTARRAEHLGIAHSFTDLDAAITQTGAAAVTIATPPHTHASLCHTALSRGCHIICEKPMAANAGEARLMLEAAEQAGIVHLLGNEFRWQPDRALIAQAIKSGMIGEPRLLTLTSFLPILADVDAPVPEWLFDKAAGGGWLGAHGSHIIDQVRTWGGEFESLSAALPITSDRREVAEDSYTVRFRLTNGIEGVLQHSAGTWGKALSTSHIAGSKGSLWCENGAVFVGDKEGIRELALPADLTLSPNYADQASNVELPFYIKLCEAFKSRIEGGRTNSCVPVPTFRDGVATMEVLDAIRESSQSGGKQVTLRHQ